MEFETFDDNCMECSVCRECHEHSNHLFSDCGIARDEDECPCRQCLKMLERMETGL